MASLAPWSILLADYARRFPLLPRAYPRDADGPAVVLPVADGWVRLLAVTPRQLRALVALVTGREPEPVPDRRPRARRLTTTAWPALRAAAARIAEGGVDLANLVDGRALASSRASRRCCRPSTQRCRRFGSLAGTALAKRRRDEVVAHGLRLGLPIAPVHRPEEFVVAEQTRVRGFFRRTDFPHLGAAPVAPFPCRLSATPVVLARPAPDARRGHRRLRAARACGARGPPPMPARRSTAFAS